MREPIRDKERLLHILDAINSLLERKDVYSLEQLKSDTIVFYGFVKLVEIIGEATYMLTKEFRAEHPNTNWAVMEKMRHVLVHGYYSISPEYLWDTIQNDIPLLKPQIETYIAELL